MADSKAKQAVLDEIVNKSKMGDKKFHSETSLQHFGENDGDEEVMTSAEDPGVHNKSVGNSGSEERGRRRTVSQPGPIPDNTVTASSARAMRRKPQRNVVYAPDIERSETPTDRTAPRIFLTSFNRGEESDTSSPVAIGDRVSPMLYNGNARNGDTKSLNSYRLYMPANDMRGSATPRKRSVVTMDAQSIRSIETHAPPPTDPQVNKKLTKIYVTLILSCMYAILLVTLGLIIYITDPWVSLPASEVYSIVLITIGFIYLSFLIYDIGAYKSVAVKNLKMKSLHDEKVMEYFRKQEEFSGTSTPGDRTPELFKSTSLPAPVLIPNKHAYCFSQGRHSGSFYLKMGAAGFALGHLVHSLLLLTAQIGILVDDNVDNDDCVNYLQLVIDIMFPTFCFWQLYFIFKYSNVIVMKAQGLAHFAFMHLIGSSLCFWVSAIVRETTLGLTLYANSKYGSEDYSTTSNATVSNTITLKGFLLDDRLDISGLYNPECIGSKAVTTIVENFSPYLYPFSVEFNILIVAVYYIIWSKIGHCDNDDNKSELGSTIDDDYNLCKIPTANENNDFTSNIVIHADCHASNRGLFLGLILMVIITGMLIIGFVFSSVDDGFLEIGYLLGDCTKLGLHLFMLIGAIIALYQMRQLDINEHPISLLDDVLLFICLPAFFMETVFSLVATISLVNIIKSIDIAVMVIQVIIQTPLIMDGLRRCSNSKKLRRRKPGREVLMFLLIANVGMWLFYTFSYKSPESLDERYAYYGKIMWSILGHVSLPLIMFFRFHSSVCFADIWDSAYKPGSEH